jgi:hypothetical protein
MAVKAKTGNKVDRASSFGTRKKGQAKKQYGKHEQEPKAYRGQGR